MIFAPTQPPNKFSKLYFNILLIIHNQFPLQLASLFSTKYICLPFGWCCVRVAPPSLEGLSVHFTANIAHLPHPSVATWVLAQAAPVEMEHTECKHSGLFSVQSSSDHAGWVSWSWRFYSAWEAGSEGSFSFTYHWSCCSQYSNTPLIAGLNVWEDATSSTRHKHSISNQNKPMSLMVTSSGHCCTKYETASPQLSQMRTSRTLLTQQVQQPWHTGKMDNVWSFLQWVMPLINFWHILLKNQNEYSCTMHWPIYKTKTPKWFLHTYFVTWIQNKLLFFQKRLKRSHSKWHFPHPR